jgi:hypothetical protein
MSFLPRDYETPQSGHYMKFVPGKNRFRVLGPAIVGNMFWQSNGEGRKPVRRRMNETITADELEVDAKTGKTEPIKHFWAFPVWNYGAKSVQILELTQKTVMQAMQALADEQDWGEPQGYDIIVTRSGSGLDTEYSTQPVPHTKLAPEIQQASIATPVYLEALFAGGDPFVPATGKPAPQPAPKHTADNDPVTYSAQQLAVKVFKDANAGLSDGERRQKWIAILKETLPGKHPANFTMKDWEKVRQAVSPTDDPFDNDANEELAATVDALGL